MESKIESKMESKMESKIQSKPITIKKYSAIDMFKCAPEFRESGVKVDETTTTSNLLLPQEFFAKCAKLFPNAECDEDKELKRNLNELMYEKAQKKHKNYLRRQRAKQAKTAQKERDLESQKQEIKEEFPVQEFTKITENKFDTLSLAGSDSGVSVKSGNSSKILQKKNIKQNNKNNTKNNNTKNNIKNNTKNVQKCTKVKTIQKFTVFKNQSTPDSFSSTPEFNLRQPTFATGLRSNFQNQGKLRASTDDKSVIGDGSSSVFVAKPVSEPRNWSNSRLHKRQPRGRIGSRS